jgi:pre-mRNA-splicing factor CDC5/CEF1
VLCGGDVRGWLAFPVVQAREKQLEEAKRLAALQKRRELVAAGIEVSRRRVRRDKGIDYATEIPFQKLAPAGVYDVSEEDRTVRGERSAPNFLMKRLNEIEEERRDEEEARERAKDKRKFKKLGEANLAQAIMMTSQLNDPSMARKRSKLDLPAPQISDVELAEIAKAGMSAGALEDGSVEGSAATKALVGTYSAAPLPTPMRTPRLPPSQDVIMEEARNIVALNSAPTPLHVRLIVAEKLPVYCATGVFSACRAAPTQNCMAALDSKV